MINLRPFSECDIQTLIGWTDSPEFLMQWAGPGFRYPLDESQLRSLVRAPSSRTPQLMAFTAVERETDRVLGHIELFAIDRQNRSARIGRVLVGPERLRGRGIGREIVLAVLEIGFVQLALHRIDLVVFDFNQQAIACYEKAGFRREGLLRDARKMGEQYWSLLLMSILEEEWRADATASARP